MPNDKFEDPEDHVQKIVEREVKRALRSEPIKKAIRQAISSAKTISKKNSQKKTAVKKSIVKKAAAKRAAAKKTTAKKASFPKRRGPGPGH